MGSEVKVSETSGGAAVSWGTEHRDGDGNLISRMASVKPPAPPKCLRPSCLWDYLWSAWLYALVCTYHSRRAAYAEANRHKKILERYRTGEPSPQTMWQAIYANIKLGCPVCKKYNVDPLLFSKKKGG